MHPEDALLASTGRKKQQQVVAEFWLWAGGLNTPGRSIRPGDVCFAVRASRRGRPDGQLGPGNDLVRWA